MPEVEGLLPVDLDQRPLPRPVAAVRVDVAQEHEPGPVVESVGDDEFREGLQRNVEGVRVLELPGATLVDQLLRVNPEVPEHPVGDVRVPQLVLHDPHDRDVVVHPGEGREIPRRPHVRRRTDQLRVRRDDQRPL